MAYSAANITGDELTAYNADKPMMVAQKATASGTGTKWTITGAYTGTDVSNTSNPAIRAHDDHGSIITKTTGVASTDVKYFNFQFGNPGIEFDSLIILGHNFNTDALDRVSLEIADSADFATNKIELYRQDSLSGSDDRITVTNLNSASSHTTTDTGASTHSNTTVTLSAMGNVLVGDSISGGSIPADTHITAVDVGASTVTISQAASGTASGLTLTLTRSGYNSSTAPVRYSAVRYARLVLQNTGSYTPEVGEIVLGRRYQLQRNPDVPWDNKHEISNTVEQTSLSGLTRRYTYYRGKAVRNVVAPIADSSEIAVIDGWWAAIEQGTKPFYYVETAKTSAVTMLGQMDNPELDFALVGPYERRLVFSMTEQPPYLSGE